MHSLTSLYSEFPLLQLAVWRRGIRWDKQGICENHGGEEVPILFPLAYWTTHLPVSQLACSIASSTCLNNAAASSGSWEKGSGGCSSSHLFPLCPHPQHCLHWPISGSRLLNSHSSHPALPLQGPGKTHRGEGIPVIATPQSQTPLPGLPTCLSICLPACPVAHSMFTLSEQCNSPSTFKLFIFFCKCGRSPSSVEKLPFSIDSPGLLI